MDRKVTRVALGFFVVSVVLCIISVRNNQKGTIRQEKEKGASSVAIKVHTQPDDVTQKYPPMILYTRTPKCGGRSLTELMHKLARKNKFRINGHVGIRPRLHTLIEDAQYIATMKTPGIHHPHLHFINFQKFGLKQPVMINLIRDPAERYVSLYYFALYGDSTAEHNRSPERPVTDINNCIQWHSCGVEESFGIGNFFCGDDSLACSKGSSESVAIAKRHIDENYMFVGITEEFDNSVKILEKILPDYFDGAVEVWSEIKANITKATATKKRAELTPESRKKLKYMLRYDYDVYNYAKAKFNKIKQALNIK